MYVGSFHDEPLAREEHAKLFSKDKQVLLNKLTDLPKACGMRKINEMVKRIRLCIVNVCVLGYLRSQMPRLWGKEAAQNKLIDNLDQVFEIVKRNYNLSEGDFPNLGEFKAVLRLSDFSTFPYTSKDTLNVLQDLLTIEIPRIFSTVAGVTNDGPTSQKENVDVSRQPLVFQVKEIKDKDHTVIGVIGSIAVLFVAVFMMSHFEDHVTFNVLLLKFLTQLKSLLETVPTK